MNNNLGADVQPGLRTQFNEGAPLYRTAAPGLNFDAHCTGCDKQVIVPVGFSEEEGFSLTNLLLCVVCPLCGGRVAPAQVGCIWFSRCAVKITARPQDGSAVRKQKETVPELLDYPLSTDGKAATTSVIMRVFPLAAPGAPTTMPAPRG